MVIGRQNKSTMGKAQSGVTEIHERLTIFDSLVVSALELRMS
jgi:hypothetical protein